MAAERPWWHNRTVLWSMAVSSMCVFAARFLDDPYDNFGGPWLHFTVLGGSGGLFVTAIVLLVSRRGDGPGGG
ncbi:hypothetical protein [Actinoplanes sp. NPDC048796]|uniref:hypothetical protein n=1 Tax=unclassified Actinoplanes TaxID=2626549 RepID=UPI0033D2DC9B